MCASTSCRFFPAAPGLGEHWGCCACQTFNAMTRDRCKYCGHQLCGAAVERLVSELGRWREFADEALGQAAASLIDSDAVRRARLRRARGAA